MSVASISEKHRLGLGALSSWGLQGLGMAPLAHRLQFGEITKASSPDSLKRTLPDPVFQLLTRVMTTSLHDHEGGGADRSFLRYTLIKGILKGGITKLVIKPINGHKEDIIRLEDEYDKDTGVLYKSNVKLLKEDPKTLEKLKGTYTDRGFYGLYITDKDYLDTRLKEIQQHERLAKIASKEEDKWAELEKAAINLNHAEDYGYKPDQHRLMTSARVFHTAQAKQLQGQLDRYAFYKENAPWFWTDFLSTDSLKLYFRFYENLEDMLKGKLSEGLQDVDSVEDPNTAEQLKTKLAKVSKYQDAVYRWSQDSSEAEKELQKDFAESRANRLTDYRRTSTIINPAVKKLHVANLNAYNFLNRLAKENVRYAEYRVSLTGNDIGDPTNQTYYYDGQDKLWAVAAGLYGAQRNNARWGNAIDFGITVLLERQPNVGRLPKAQQDALKELPTDSPEVKAKKRAAKIALSLTEAHRVVDLAITNKREAIANNIKKKKEGDTNLDPRERITGIDLAGDEANYPVDVFAPVFEKVHTFNEEMIRLGKPKHCLGITIHAGEEPFSSDATENRQYKWSDSIKNAYKVGYRGPNELSKGKPVTPFRIGHGIMLWAADSEGGLLRKEYAAYTQNPRKWANELTTERRDAIVAATPLINNLLKSNVGIELCPKSNVQTGSVPYYTVHPALFFLKLGLKVSVNTDNRTISNTDNANELIKLHQHLGLRWDEVKKLLKNGVDTAFIPKSTERTLIKKDMLTRFEELERDPKTLLGIMLLNGYTPTRYKYTDPSKPVSPIDKQLVGLYKRINDETFQKRAIAAEAKRHEDVLSAIETKTAELRDQKQPWVANA
ncbi:MAG: hypothetical protein QE263_03065 [Vampirovibrionales bacterium]|nr:hypothetical protein [Vampirovibrionales bacterium]